MTLLQQAENVAHAAYAEAKGVMTRGKAVTQRLSIISERLGDLEERLSKFESQFHGSASIVSDGEDGVKQHADASLLGSLENHLTRAEKSVEQIFSRVENIERSL